MPYRTPRTDASFRNGKPADWRLRANRLINEAEVEHASAKSPARRDHAASVDAPSQQRARRLLSKCSGPSWVMATARLADAGRQLSKPSRRGPLIEAPAPNGVISGGDEFGALGTIP
jgi:hypothetical protein